jgi:ketosteroid isomerase-like protein
MSAGDVELVRRWFDGLDRGDLGLELVASNVEIRNWDEFPITGPYVGHDGVEQWWGDISEAFDHFEWELREATDAGGGRVVTVQRFTGRFRLTGIDVDFHWGSVITVADGRIESAVGYATPGGAKRAAGLPRDEGGG